MSTSFGAPQITPLSQLGVMPDLPDVPDTPDMSGQDSATPVSGGGLVDFGGLVESFRSVGGALEKAGKAEQAFLHGKGNLLEMVLDRAKADTLLTLASSTASKTTQAASTMMNLQV